MIISFIKSQVGLSMYTRVLEAPRVMQSLASTCWGDDEQETRYLLEWYSNSVHLVRKRLIEQVTGSFRH